MSSVWGKSALDSLEHPIHCSSVGAFIGAFVGFVAVLRGAFVGVLMGLVRDPDSRPGLRLLDSSSSAGTSPMRVTVGRAARLLAGAAPQSTPSLQSAGTQMNCNPQLVSLPGCEGPIKHLGFIFICVCVRVWRRL